MPRDPAGTAYRLEGEGGSDGARAARAGTPIVLIHGVGLDQGMWAAQRDALAPLGPLITYDLLGHGQTPARPGENSLADFRDQLAKLLTYLSVKHCRLIGFSMGGLVARAFAANWPARVSALVVMSSVFARDAEQRQAVDARCEALAAGGPAATLEAALERWFTPGFAAAHPETIETLRRQLLGNDPEGFLKAYRVFATEDREPDKALARIACPTLVVTGEDDGNSTPAMAEALAARIPGARAQVLPGRRHMMPVEAADEINAALVAFLEDLPAR